MYLNTFKIFFCFFHILLNTVPLKYSLICLMQTVAMKQKLGKFINKLSPDVPS